jgi:MFS family permease
MAQRREIAAVYTAAVVQGIVLVAFPAVSAIFTSPAHYGLSNTEYGGLFVPQAITAILASLLGAGLTRRIGGKGVLLLGLVADLLSMALLFASQFAIGAHGAAYVILLAATTCLGVGFGFTVPALNTFTAAFFPEKIDTAILTLNALLGVGTALAPIFAILFVGLGFWWGLPVVMSALTLALLLFSLRLPLKEGAAPPGPTVKTRMRIPARFGVYAAFALVYGICETLNANWATVYLSAGLGASIALASLALTVFWVSVTVGRILFALIEKGARRPGLTVACRFCSQPHFSPPPGRRAPTRCSRWFSSAWLGWAARPCCRSSSASGRRNCARCPRRWREA